MDWSIVIGVALGGAIGLLSASLERRFRLAETAEARRHEKAATRRARLEDLYAGWLKTVNGLGQWMIDAIVRGNTGDAMRKFELQMRDMTVEAELFGSEAVFAAYRKYNEAMKETIPAAMKAMQEAAQQQGPTPPLVFGATLLERTESERKALVQAMRSDLSVD